MQNIRKRDVLAYATMPRVVPRFKALFSTGFSYVALLLAHIYSMVKLLPEGHPYLQTANMGRFGVQNVLAEAGRRLVFSRKHMDQVFIYFATLAGIVLLFAQLVILVVGFLMPYMLPEAAAISLFALQNPGNDVAYTLLDRVFGVPGIFCVDPAVATTCTAYAQDTNGTAIAGTPVIPRPYHIALHGLFEFYSTALLLIAILMFLYFVVVILVETAVSGTPFGQRFQNVWVPVRLVVALGLLVPLPGIVGTQANGLNSGQYIVLYAAKYGSSFATNGWSTYNNSVAGHSMFGGTAATDGMPLGERYTYLAMPEAPDMTPLLEAMTLIHGCAYAYHVLASGDANLVLGGSVFYPSEDANYTDASTPQQFKIEPFFVKQPTTSQTAQNGQSVGGVTLNDARRLRVDDSGTIDYIRALGFFYLSDIVITFGMYIPGSPEPGEVEPLCGSVRIPVPSVADLGGYTAGRGGADGMLYFYYQSVLDAWFNAPHYRRFVRGRIEHKLDNGAGLVAACAAVETGGSASGSMIVDSAYPGLPDDATACRAAPPNAAWRTRLQSDAQANLRSTIVTNWRQYVINGTQAQFTSDIEELGWGGAGVWYNKIAEINGGWLDGVNQTPVLRTYPFVMEEVRRINKTVNEKVSVDKIFEPSQAAQSQQEGPDRIEISDEELNRVAAPLDDLYKYWNEEQSKQLDSVKRVEYSNVFMDAVNILLGTTGLASMRTVNKHLHPLAQLVAVGRGLVNSAVLQMGMASASAFMGGMLGALSDYQAFSQAAETASRVFVSLAFMGLTAGFVLFYVLPFLPFIYFYFAVASWVKSIFEAMVGVPLWALAHLRIDGEGLPGDAAQNGYFLILEIFIRPILTVVGLVAAVVIFATQVQILNMIWDLVISNTSGYMADGNILTMNKSVDVRYHRNVIDQFFFTIIYTIVCYMMALASFKLIDKIPDNILRWAGAGVSSFGDIDQESVDSISRYASVGGMTLGTQASGAISDAAGGLGGVLGKAVSGGPRKAGES